MKKNAAKKNVPSAGPSQSRTKTAGPSAPPATPSPAKRTLKHHRDADFGHTWNEGRPYAQDWQN